MYKLSKTSLRNRAGIDERLILIDNLAIQITQVDFGHGKHSGLRIAGVQSKLYADGKSLLDGVHRKSKHQDGKALDFYAWVNGKVSFERDHLAMIAAAYLQAASILGYKLEWGGLWSPNHTKNNIKYGWDCCHIQLID